MWKHKSDFLHLFYFFSRIIPLQNYIFIIFQNQSSFVFGNDENELNSQNKEGKDEYVDDDDVGFDTYVVNEDNFVLSCRELANIHNFPGRAIKPDTQEY